MRFSQLPGSSDERLIDARDIDLGVHLVKLGDSRLQLQLGDPTHPLRLSERSPTFDVHERDADDPLRLVPHLPGHA